jgi:hypothetical protein
MALLVKENPKFRELGPNAYEGENEDASGIMAVATIQRTIKFDSTIFPCRGVCRMQQLVNLN